MIKKRQKSMYKTSQFITSVRATDKSQL